MRIDFIHTNAARAIGNLFDFCLWLLANTWGYFTVSVCLTVTTAGPRPVFPVGGMRWRCTGANHKHTPTHSFANRHEHSYTQHNHHQLIISFDRQTTSKWSPKTRGIIKSWSHFSSEELDRKNWTKCTWTDTLFKSVKWRLRRKYQKGRIKNEDIGTARWLLDFKQ